MMVTAVEGIFLAGAWGGFIGVYMTGSYTAGFLLAMICGLLVAMLYGVYEPASDRDGYCDRDLNGRIL